ARRDRLARDEPRVRHAELLDDRLAEVRADGIAEGTVVRVAATDPPRERRRGVADGGAERREPDGRRRVVPRERREAPPLGEEARLLGDQLTVHDREDVRGDERVVAPRPVEARHHVLLEENPYGVEELLHGRPVLHAHASVSSSSSSSISATRRPRLASSTLFTAPSRNVRACMMQMIAHLRFPKTSHQRTAAGSTSIPPALSPPAGRSSAPKRQERTQSHPTSSSGSPTCAISQSRTARSPSGPKMT